MRNLDMPTDIEILQTLTPELVERIAKDIRGAKYRHQHAMVIAHHGDLIIASMKAALKWKAELALTRKEGE